LAVSPSPKLSSYLPLFFKYFFPFPSYHSAAKLIIEKRVKRKTK